VLKKKIWANFRIIELFTQKIVTKLSKIWVRDPGSEIRKKPILDPGSRGRKGTGSRIRIRNTENGYFIKINFSVSHIRIILQVQHVLINKLGADLKLKVGVLTARYLVFVHVGVSRPGIIKVPTNQIH
jgi:hypothetical protein